MTIRAKKRYYTAVIAIVLIAAIFLPILATAATAFTDVDPNTRSAQYIEYVTKLGLFSGTSATTFSPSAPMTRAMFVTILGRLYELSGHSISARRASPFRDVEKNSWYDAYVTWAAENGLASGYGNGKFGPNDNVTREQAAVFLHRFANFMNIMLYRDEMPIEDAGIVSSWAKAEVTAVVGGGLMRTSSNKNFRPRENATRAQLAEAMYHFVRNYTTLGNQIGLENNPLYRNAGERAALQPWIDDVMNLKVTKLNKAQKENFFGYWVGYFTDKHNALVTQVEISTAIDTMDYTSVIGRVRIAKRYYDYLDDLTAFKIEMIVGGLAHEIAGHGTETIVTNTTLGIEVAMLKEGKYPLFKSLFDKVYSHTYTHGSFWEIRAIYKSDLELWAIYNTPKYRDTYAGNVNGKISDIIADQAALYMPSYAVANPAKGSNLPKKSGYRVTRAEYVSAVKQIYAQLYRANTPEKKQQMYDLIYYAAYYLGYSGAPQYGEMMDRVNRALERVKAQAYFNDVGDLLPGGATLSDVQAILTYCGI